MKNDRKNHEKHGFGPENHTEKGQKAVSRANSGACEAPKPPTGAARFTMAFPSLKAGGRGLLPTSPHCQAALKVSFSLRFGWF